MTLVSISEQLNNIWYSCLVSFHFATLYLEYILAVFVFEFKFVFVHVYVFAFIYVFLILLGHIVGVAWVDLGDLLLGEHVDQLQEPVLCVLLVQAHPLHLPSLKWHQLQKVSISQLNQQHHGEQPSNLAFLQSVDIWALLHSVVSSEEDRLQLVLSDPAPEMGPCSSQCTIG